MADKGIQSNALVDPTREMTEMWIKVEIQQKRSIIVRKNQDIEDLQKGRILDLTAQIKLHELEIKKLETDLLKSKSIQA